MIIEELLEQSRAHSKIATKVLSSGPNHKVIAMAFQKGMVLKEHSSPLPARLYVLDGIVQYTEGDSITELSKHHDVEIRQGVLHSLNCLVDSVCLLIKG
jgi:quercetin dioxygenase-like cupin family protein